jgi:hypothetical protein
MLKNKGFDKKNCQIPCFYIYNALPLPIEKQRSRQNRRESRTKNDSQVHIQPGYRIDRDTHQIINGNRDDFTVPMAGHNPEIAMSSSMGSRSLETIESVDYKGR